LQISTAGTDREGEQEMAEKQVVDWREELKKLEEKYQCDVREFSDLDDIEGGIFHLFDGNDGPFIVVADGRLSNEAVSEIETTLGITRVTAKDVPRKPAPIVISCIYDWDEIPVGQLADLFAFGETVLEVGGRSKVDKDDLDIDHYKYMVFYAKEFPRGTAAEYVAQKAVNEHFDDLD
jgi:hypothetical protein